ncbi:MAG: RtcB family protein [Proteobacteria bacterium]|nr:RtcB family protein [Pseudomonadota bacterium]
MIEIKGSHNTALCYCDVLDELAAKQIQELCNQEAFSSSKIRVMPDVHAGKGCTIGTTMTITNKIVPNMVGVDIGCGMETVQIAEREIDYERLDKIIRRNIPSGRQIRDTHHPLNDAIDLTALRCADDVKLERARRSIGTLGGGNHFIEIERADDGALFLVVHSGSRHLGTEVANLYQQAAIQQCQRSASAIPTHLAYATGSLFNDYIHDMKIVQRFAVLNRQAMVEVILSAMGLTKVDAFTTIHNYIDTDNMIMRKGAIAANAGLRVLIPINMRDGSLVCLGKGNGNWNQSAPHGAGRLMSRHKAFDTLSMNEYRQQMQGIFSTSISQKTLDEAPMAYKSMASIVAQITPTADILMHLRPVYNFKSPD